MSDSNLAGIDDILNPFSRILFDTTCVRFALARGISRCFEVVSGLGS